MITLLRTLTGISGLGLLVFGLGVHVIIHRVVNTRGDVDCVELTEVCVQVHRVCFCFNFSFSA